jgi:hypothetical protein
VSALRLVPWPVHQAFVYVAGVFLVLAPFVLDLVDGGPLAVFVGAGVVLLGLGVLGKPPAGVANLLPLPVHAGMVYLTGFFLVLAPFMFAFRERPTALATSVFAGLAIIVVSLLTAFPIAADTKEPSVEA